MGREVTICSKNEVCDRNMVYLEVMLGTFKFFDIRFVWNEFFNNINKLNNFPYGIRHIVWTEFP